MKNKAALYALGALLFFLLLGALLDWLLPIAGTDRILLWVGFIALGALTALLLFLQLRPRAAPGAVSPETDVDLPIRSARTRLAGAGVARGKLGRLPLALVLGSAGSAKTTYVIESGNRPDLLAGEVSGSEGTRPTTSVNLWYAQDSVIVEAGGPLLSDDARWNRLLQHLRPSRWAAALGRGRQAPRQVIVCLGCDDLLRAGAHESLMATAAALRNRLAEAARALGVRLPVYVVFTKADRIPHFEEFVRGLTREEAQQLLGVTLPLEPIGPGEYAERQGRRLRESFRSLFRSLARWRLHALPREASEVNRTGAYEFPREILKLSTLAEAFLLELCRPSQLGVNPVLRGYFFGGVRPIVVSDVPSEGQAGAPAQKISLGATGVFSIQSLQQGQPQPAPAAGSRRVPDWVFLRRLLPDHVLRDEAAKALTAGGTRVDHLRRGLVSTAAVLCLLLAGALVVSYGNNRALASEAFTAVRGIEPVRATVAEPPSHDALRRVEDARGVLVRLRRFDQDGRPLGYAWGLYRGGSILPPLRQAYFDRFARLVWTDARGDLLGTLEGLPAAPQETSDYGLAYDALKAHLVTTSHPAESSGAFLTPVVLRHWGLAPALDDERVELVRRQVQFFGDELPFGDPFADTPVQTTVVRTRAFLQQFTGTEPLYQALLAEAAREGAPVDFHRVHPGSEAVVRNTYVVPAAFTRGGFEHVQAALGNIDRLLSREDWVVGERSLVPAQDRARLAQELRTRYVADYVGAWREFLRNSAVVPFGGPAQAASSLARLSGNESPVLQLLALVSQHTAVDTLEVGRAFQPIHMVVPPGGSGQLVSESNAPYLDALAQLQAAMDQVAQASGPARVDAAAQVAGTSDQVSLQIRQLAQGFNIQGDAREVGLAVQRLLSAPISGAGTLARAMPAAEVNAGGPSFCAPFRQLGSRYPFNPRGSTDASLDDVAQVLQPGGSVLWAFYEEALQNLLSRQGTRYAARIGADPQPTAAFVNFFNRAAEISTGLYPREGAGPQASFALRPQTSELIPEVRLVLDGQSHTFTRTVAAARTFTWDAERAQTARLIAQVGGVEQIIAEGRGPWGVFRMLQAGEWDRTGTGRYQIRWRTAQPGAELTAEITFAGSAPLFAPGFLGPVECVSQIVR